MKLRDGERQYPDPKILGGTSEARLQSVRRHHFFGSRSDALQRLPGYQMIFKLCGRGSAAMREIPKWMGRGGREERFK